MVRDEKVLAQVAALMQSLHWSGVANIDFKLDEQKGSMTVLEVNPRYWGSLLASLYAGVNFPYLACLEGMGLPLPESEFRPVRFTWHKRRLVAGLLAPKGKERVQSHGTVVRYLLADPMPELVEFGWRIGRRW
jgi:predicted ATP-grasp superfamily ATP-dependent carboligase